MEEVENFVKQQIKNIPLEFINLLRNNDSLNHFTRNFIINLICNQVDLKIDFDQISKNYFKKNNIQDEEKFQINLAYKGMLLKDHERNLINSEKIRFIAFREFGKNAETEFLKNKAFMDVYTYSLITVKDPDLAHEIYLQIESGENEFSKLAKDYSFEANINQFGLVGPANLAKTHPLIREKLFAAQQGELFNPFIVDNWWIILRLEEKVEAKLDENIKSNIVFSLFDKWINILTINCVKDLLLVNEE